MLEDSSGILDIYLGYNASFNILIQCRNLKVRTFLLLTFRAVELFARCRTTQQIEGKMRLP